MIITNLPSGKDFSQATADASKILNGYTAFGNTGSLITGTALNTTTTATAANIVKDLTAYDNLGNLITGTGVNAKKMAISSYVGSSSTFWDHSITFTTTFKASGYACLFVGNSNRTAWGIDARYTYYLSAIYFNSSGYSCVLYNGMELLTNEYPNMSVTNTTLTLSGSGVFAINRGNITWYCVYWT